jgi:predicted component of type VI protein secretion system
MKKFGLALVGAASLALAGCSGNNQDSLNNVDLNANAGGDLNALANDAANVAAEAEALGNQAQQLEQEANNSTATDELNASGNTSVEENVTGM